MDPNLLIADRLIETVRLPTQRWFRSEEEKRNFFLDTSNEFLGQFAREMDLCVQIFPPMIDIFKAEKQRIVAEFRDFFQGDECSKEMERLNLRMLAFGELAATVIIPKQKVNGVDLDLFAAIGFASAPTLKKYATKIQQFMELLTNNLFHGRELLAGRRVERGSYPEPSGIVFFVDGISTKISVYINNSPPVPYFASELISVYEQYDPRFLSICSFIHIWLTSISTSNLSKFRKYTNTIPSLSKIALLVVYFFQHYGIFPRADVLHEESPAENVPNDRIPGHGSIRLTKKDLPPCASSFPPANSALLLFLFFDFYSQVVSPNTHVLELGSHSAISKREFKSHIRNILLFRDVFDDVSPGSRVSNVFGLTLAINAARNLMKERLERFRFDVFIELKAIDLDALTAPKKSRKLKK